MKRETKECRQFHKKKYWTGKFGYFWVDDVCTLYCHCTKCNRRFEMEVDNKDFVWGSPYYKTVKIDYNTV